MATPKSRTGVAHALEVALEHLSTSGNPKQNWGQFLALVRQTGEFSEEEISRYNRLYFDTKQSDPAGPAPSTK